VKWSENLNGLMGEKGIMVAFGSLTKGVMLLLQVQNVTGKFLLQVFTLRVLLLLLLLLGFENLENSDKNRVHKDCALERKTAKLLFDDDDDDGDETGCCSGLLVMTKCFCS